MYGVKFRLIAHKDSGLKKAPEVLSRNMRSGLSAVGKRLQASARTRMRKDTGASQRSLRVQVSGTGLNLAVAIYSQLIQAFIDAYGMRRGVFPNFAVNSPLYNWVNRRFRGIPVKEITTLEKATLGKRRPHLTKLRTINRGGGRLANVSQRTKAKNSNVKRMTFLIARAIYKKGIQASGWPKRTLEANQQMIKRELRNALARTVTELSRG